MTESSSPTVFAGRYRFEPVADDWDGGQSGFAQLVYDLKKERLAVLKRAEIASERTTARLKNEARALIALMGLWVPQVYETGRAIHDSKNYFYVVTEYIDGLHLERELDSLEPTERAQILTQFFRLLRQAHRRGIVKGDLDLTHLIWRRDDKELFVLGWENARLGVDPKKKTEFADDLARSAEIIFSLVTNQAHVPETGSIALPGDSDLAPGLAPLPLEFHQVCQWARHAPADTTAAPHTASELFAVSKRWLAAVKSSRPYQPTRPARGWYWLFGASILVVLFCMGLIARSVISNFPLAQAITLTTPAPTLSAVPSSDSSSLSESTKTSPRATPTIPPISSPQGTPTLAATPALTGTTSIESSPIVIFDNQPLTAALKNCWQNETSPFFELKNQEGLYRSFVSGDEDWWNFSIDRDRAPGQLVQTDFRPCLGDQPVGAMALNAWVTRLEPERGDMPGMEFGIFLEGQSGQRREYTLWIDETEIMHLRIREDNQDISDQRVQIATLHHGQSPRGPYDQFLIQIFLEVDNAGMAVLYLLEGPSRGVRVGELNPSQMTRIDRAVLPAFDDIQKIGLVGRGGPTKVILWPLALFAR